MKQQVACNYAVLRFRPYMETGEFVNVGAVLIAHTVPWFGFRVEAKRHRRVTDFFPELGADRYREAREAFTGELRRVQAMMTDPGLHLTPADRLGIFSELVRTRESVFRFGETGTVFAHDPAAALDAIFRHHVLRQFAKAKEYQETIMARRLGNLLDANDLLDRYRANALVGDQRFHAKFAFVSRDVTAEGIPKRAIKPLDLDRPDRTRIYEHGDAWVQRVRRLRQMNTAPTSILVPIRVPQSNATCRAAADEIEGELAREGILVVPEADEARLLAFARAG